MKRGQTALEYLMTYGWAILIVIIVGAALYSLGVFSPGTWTGKRTTGFAQFHIVDFKYSTNGTLTFVIGNRIGKTVNLNNIILNYINNLQVIVKTYSMLFIGKFDQSEGKLIRDKIILMDNLKVVNKATIRGLCGRRCRRISMA